MLYYIIYFITCIFIIIIYYQYKIKSKIFTLYKNIMTPNELILYNIIQQQYNDALLYFEPSVKIVNNIYTFGRFSIPIFNYTYDNRIKNILNNLLNSKLILKYTPNNKKIIKSFIKNNSNTNTDLIIGIDINTYKLKFYIDTNNKIISLVYNYKTNIITYKIYNTITNYNPLYKLLKNYNINLKIDIFNIDNINVSTIINNNIGHVYYVKPNEYHVILLKQQYNIYVVGIKPNEITLYFR